MFRKCLAQSAVALALSAPMLTLPFACRPARPAAEEGVIDVAMINIAFVPKEVTIRRGETVRWTNLEALPIPHTATSGRPGDRDAGALFDSGNMNSGTSFRHTFNETGEFVYFCIPHQTTPAMVDAVVRVVEEGEAAKTSQARSAR